MDRILGLARDLATRESGRDEARAAARALADRLRADVISAADAFAREVGGAGAPHLDLIRVGAVEPDDKSVRAFQFRVSRGRHHLIVVSKDRGDVMIVGPFRHGEAEGPCRPVRPGNAEDAGAALEAAIEQALVDLIDQGFSR